MQDSINEQIQERFRTLEEGWLENIVKDFQKIESSLLMHDIIKQLETANILWQCENVENAICELNGIYWKQHHEKGKKKLTKLIFPVESYAEIHKDQLEINAKTKAKWKRTH